MYMKWRWFVLITKILGMPIQALPTRPYANHTEMMISIGLIKFAQAIKFAGWRKQIENKSCKNKAKSEGQSPKELILVFYFSAHT